MEFLCRPIDSKRCRAKFQQDCEETVNLRLKVMKEIENYLNVLKNKNLAVLTVIREKTPSKASLIMVIFYIQSSGTK